MGVKDMWPILSPAREECTLDSLAGKTLAVDLSGWVCQAQTTKGLASAVEKPHLRNLFFRVCKLYHLGASLVFVMDGEATQLKWEAMDRRERGRGRGRGRGAARGRWTERRTGARTQLNHNIRECCELLSRLGVPYLQSAGEAEAYCALLNARGIVDGVLTQDNDAFLYGATVVYRDLSITVTESRVDRYTLETIQQKLDLNRHDLVSLALLLGCDYCPQGVPGVGREKSLKLISACKSSDQSCDMLERFRTWKDAGEGEVLCSLEGQIRRKAREVPGFPSEEVIREYLVPKDRIPRDVSDVRQWKMPRMHEVQEFCVSNLEWSRSYSLTKTLPLLTQWVLREVGRGQAVPPGSIRPTVILHQRVRHSVPCYEVQWEEDTAKNERITGITLENAQQFEATFPELCAEFREHEERVKQQKKARKKKIKPGLSPDVGGEFSASVVEPPKSLSSVHPETKDSSETESSLDKGSSSQEDEEKGEPDIPPLMERMAMRGKVATAEAKPKEDICVPATYETSTLTSPTASQSSLHQFFRHQKERAQEKPYNFDDRNRDVQVTKKRSDRTIQKSPVKEKEAKLQDCCPVKASSAQKIASCSSDNESGSDVEELPLFARLKRKQCRDTESTTTKPVHRQVGVCVRKKEEEVEGEETAVVTCTSGGSRAAPIVID